MTASASTTKLFPSMQSLFSAFSAWVQKRRMIRDCYLRLEQCDNNEIAAIAKDVGISPRDLRRMARLGHDAAKLLYERMGALHLDAKTISMRQPGTMRDLERLCSICATKGRCQRDLTHDRDNPVWHQYCPNEDTLSALQMDVATRQTQA